MLAQEKRNLFGLLLPKAHFLAVAPGLVDLGLPVNRIWVARPVRRLHSVPERLDRVAIATSRDVIELSWASRDSLLHEIRHLGENAKPIRTAFEAVGASRPVELSRADQTTLFSAIELWADSVTVESLPPGIWQLRCALADQLDEG